MKERGPRKSLRKEKSKSVGLFIGRFQPLHKGHLKAIKQSAQQVDFLWIGIGSINKERTQDNPFTFRERVWMINKVLEAEKISNYCIFGIKDEGDDTRWSQNIIAKVGMVNAVFTGNPWTARCFKDQQYNVKIISLYKDFTATKIREAMRGNTPWVHMVPRSIHVWLKRRVSTSKSF